MSYYVLPLVLFLLATPSLHAQATPTAVRDAEISVFGTYSLVFTDRDSSWANGGTLGADFTSFLPHKLAVSLEIRAKAAGGYVVNQYTYGGGARVERHMGNFHPYADFLWNYGSIALLTAPPPYRHNNSVVYSPGAGVDYDLSRHWAVRADVQLESWRLDRYNSFNPIIYNVGVVYRIPFRSSKKP
jgi:hypothetical protein